MTTPSAPPVSGRRRDSALVRTLRTGAALQVTVVLASIVSLPFVTRALTSSEYGVLATLTATMPLLAFADLGTGAAVTQMLSRATASGDPDRPREIVTAALVVMACVGVVVSVVGTCLAVLLPWREIFDSPGISSGTLTASTLITCLAVALFLFGGLGQATLYGLQRGGTANRWLMVSAVATAGISIGLAMMSAPLWAFVLAAVGVPAACALACTAWVIVSIHTPDLRPRRGHVSPARLIAFSGTSGWFFLIGVSAAVGFQTDTLVAATVIGASSAAVLSVAQRLFGLVSSCLYPFLLQTWPAFAEASATGDRAWILSRFRIATALACSLSAVLCGALVLFGNQVISTVLTDELTSPTSLLVVIALWTVYSLTTAPMFFLMNALGRVRTHALMAASVATLNLPLSIVLAQWIGVAGPPLATLVASVLLQGAPGIVVVRRMLADLRADMPITGRSGQA